MRKEVVTYFCDKCKTEIKDLSAHIGWRSASTESSTVMGRIDISLYKHCPPLSKIDLNVNHLCETCKTDFFGVVSTWLSPPKEEDKEEEK